MNYHVYRTDNHTTFVIAIDDDGATKAQTKHGKLLGNLHLWKSIETLDRLVGIDPAPTVKKNLNEHGYHVQSTEVRFREQDL